MARQLRFKPISLPTNCHPLVRRLYALANEQQCSILQLAKMAGTHPSTIFGWAHNYSPSFTILEACFNYLGYDITVKERK